MREGSALDAELAEAIGMPVEELPEGKVWERERAYFLRDLFLEKVFRERGLVTRASNTARMLRTQQVVLFGCSALALLLFLFFAWYGTRNLKNTVRTQSEAWMTATNWWPNNKTLKQSIIPQTAGGVYARYATNEVEFPGQRMSIGKFHSQIRKQATNQTKFNWLMPTLAPRYSRDSQKAQRIVFEGGVVKPLVEAARDRMRAAVDSRAIAEHGQAEAFTSLLQVEGDLRTHNKGSNTGVVTEDKARSFLTSLLIYVTGREWVPDSSFSNLVEIMSWTYSKNEEARGHWPSAGLSSAVGEGGPLASFPDLRIGFDLYLTNFSATAEKQFKEWRLVSEIVEILGRAKETEEALFRAAEAGVEKEVDRHWDAIAKISNELDGKRAAAAQANLFRDGFYLTNAHSRFVALVGSGGDLQIVRSNAAYYAGLCPAPKGALFNEIAKRLEDIQSEMLRRVEKETKGGTGNFAALDKSFLGRPGFIERGGFYQDSFRLASSSTNFIGASLIGARGDPWQSFDTNTLRRIRSRAESYDGDSKDKDRFKQTVGVLSERTRRRQLGVFLTNYMAEAERKFGGLLGFPLVKPPAPPMTVDNFAKAYRELDSIARDLAASSMPPSPPDEGHAWNQFVKRSTNMAAVALAILGDQSTPSDCVVSLLKPVEGKDDDKWRDAWRHIQLMGISVQKAIRTQGSSDDIKLGSLGADKQLILHLYKSTDAKDDPSVKDNRAVYDAGEWGAINLLHQQAGQKQKEDPSTWTVSRSKSTRLNSSHGGISRMPSSA